MWNSRTLRSLRLCARAAVARGAGDDRTHSWALARGLARNRSLREVCLPLGVVSSLHSPRERDYVERAARALAGALEGNPAPTRLVFSGGYYRPMEHLGGEHAEEALRSIARNVALREVAVGVARAARGAALRRVVEAMTSVGFQAQIMRFLLPRASSALPPPPWATTTAPT